MHSRAGTERQEEFLCGEDHRAVKHLDCLDCDDYDTCPLPYDFEIIPEDMRQREDNYRIVSRKVAALETQSEVVR